MAEHILVADDAAFVRARCVRLLSEFGYEVLEASDGEEAFVQYMKYRPGLVLMDVSMPVVDGIAGLQRIIRADPEARVVMLSPLGNQAVLMKAIGMGARDYVTKPYQPEQLVAVVRRYKRQPIAT